MNFFSSFQDKENMKNPYGDKKGQLPWYQVLAFDLARLPWLTILSTVGLGWFCKFCLDYSG